MKKAIYCIIAAALVLGSIAEATTNEITLQALLRVRKGAVNLERNSGQIQFQFAGTKYNIQTITCTTTKQNLTKGSVGTCGWAYMRNIATNGSPAISITFDGGTTTSLVLEAQEPALFRIAPNAVVSNFTAATTTGTADLEFTIFED